MVPFLCLGTRHTEDNVVVADFHGSQWQQKGKRSHWALKLPLVTQLSEGAWASLADSLKQEQLEWD